MKKRLLFIPLLALSLGMAAQTHTATLDKYITIYTNVLKQLDINYADTLNIEELVTSSISQMLRKVDPYTVYYPEDRKSDLQRMTTGKYGGIGAIIMQRGDTVMISQPYAGKPAQKADLRAGDKILEVNGEKAIKKTTAEVSQMLRGVPNSEITVKIEREGEKKPLVKTFKREEVKMNPVNYTRLIDGHIGYILFDEFTEHSANDFTDSLAILVAQGADNLIIDLRSNGGGLISEAVQMMSLFVEKGTEIVRTKGKIPSSNRTYRTTTTPLYPTMPVTILVDQNTASASEIFAGAMQDLDRGTIIGTRTFGKGLVQNVREVPYNGNLKITTAKYYIPSGRCVQAIDYAHRRDDGSVERVPDSLTHEFKTLKGRTVRDGGGIVPDIVIEDSAKLTISAQLYYKNYFFDYSVHYRQHHETLPAAKDIELTDELLEDFIQWLEVKNFVYKPETVRYYDEMLKTAKEEAMDEALLADLETMRERLTPTARETILRQREDVGKYLLNEIIARYYFERGMIEYSLRYDKVFDKAVEMIKK